MELVRGLLLVVAGWVGGMCVFAGYPVEGMCLLMAAWLVDDVWQQRRGPG